MYTFEKRDEGYLVSASNGTAVCDIKTFELGIKEEVKGGRIITSPDNKPVPREQWLVHFTAVRLTPAELTTLATEIANLG